MQLNELSLFTGIGGGLLGTKLLGWRHIGYVEIDEYCQRVLEQRIKDGILDDAPIFGDIREFNRTYAKEFKGVADVITAGFPCQPFSVAGKRKGESDERNMWPATIESIRIVRPRYVLLENVPGLLAAPKLWLVALEKIRQVDIFGKANKNSLMSRLNRLIFKAFGVSYLGRIFGDLAESGYDIRWRCLSAAEVGANHRRNRLWVMAQSDSIRLEKYGICNPNLSKRSGKTRTSKESEKENLADTTNSRTQGMCKRENETPEVLADSEGAGARTNNEGLWSRIGGIDRGETTDVADTRCRNSGKIQSEQFSECNESANISESRQDVADTAGNRSKTRNADTQAGQEGDTGIIDNESWWSVEPDLGRLAHGIPDRVERLKAIGNAQVPLVVRAVWGLLNDPE